MNEIKYNKSQVVTTWNGIEVFSIDGKYGLDHPENDVLVPAIYDNIEWDKGSDLIMVSQGDKSGFLSAEDGHFIDFNDEDPDDPYRGNPKMAFFFVRLKDLVEYKQNAESQE